MFLAVAGETLRCLRDTWRRLPDEVQGELARTEDMGFANTQQHHREAYEGSVLWLTTTEANTFRASILTAEVTAESDADGLLGARTMEVHATLGQGEAVYYLVNGEPTIYWRFTLTIREA